ncbi:helix-turn-helix transcriptional regulator [Flavitalea sp. BT771]|uniref:helix-turn-helix transcriptional regulator n=1 Tax=Flavitalea sp. BT771 TaxID=3063329 RepID=UPI0026E2FBB2|nr:helix-turn-helix transcriptional regulator [Flavitalea sp. BT771]MDO6432861.1 helix-turn-helix transcriptional regulator [Flavitalea sp. BT771]MDV6221863.1 helix-turn-helix transcriptional regulator [Flavitalea sp. BT771]
MPHLEFKPAGPLADYIDAYWIRKTSSDIASSDTASSGRRVYADGCADIIVNAGSTTAWFHPMAIAGQAIPLQPGQMYLGGTMTAYGVVTAPDGCILTGIRFRPGGFYALYQQPMAPAVDSLLAFSEPDLHSLMRKEPLALHLDNYFSAKKINTRHDFSAIYQVIYASKGQITVEALAGEWHMSTRTMERVFAENVGIPPKEFILIVRFQEVLRRLREGHAGASHRTAPETIHRDRAVPDIAPRESLLRIAFELGYHDHAHLTNAFKKYAGILPSELSRFYKTGMSFGQYF